MTVYRVSWRDHNQADREHREDHDTEHAALTHADELARRGVLAFVYPIEIQESESA